MGVITYYWKNKTPDQTHGLTEIYPTSTPKLILIIGHGIGERGNEGTDALKKSSGWSGWGAIKAAADTYGIIQLYINTPHDYEYGEYQFAVAWAKKKYAALNLTKSIWVLGHSLGSYGMGKYAMRDSTFPPQIAGWIMSASGNFVDGSVSTVWNNIVNNGLKVWGVTATNDTVSGTSPTPITSMYSGVKAINSGAHVLKSVFPNTEWPDDYPPDDPDTPEDERIGSKAAHNAVLNRITSRPMYYSGGNFKLITTGQISSGSPNIAMNIFQWMLANPKGCNYKDPTTAYVGSDCSNLTPTNVEVKDLNWDPDIKVGLLTWADTQSEYIKAASGDSISNVYIRRNSNKQLIITVDYDIAPSKNYGPYRT